MELVLYMIVLFGLGTVLGSFACCQAWRLRYKELGKKDLGPRSVCMHCKKTLTWRENIPIISWCVQRGRCKKCGKKIGWMELFSEISLGLAMVGVGVVKTNGKLTSLFDVNVAMQLMMLMVALTLMWILLIYDAKWRVMPTRILVALLVASGVYGLLNGWGIISVSGWGGALGQYALGVLEAAAILGGLYLALYLLSGETWVGGGDWWLALAIGIILGTPWLAVLELLVANVLACVVMLPQAAKTGKNQLPMGPFLVIGFVVVYILQHFWMI